MEDSNSIQETPSASMDAGAIEVGNSRTEPIHVSADTQEWQPMPSPVTRSKKEEAIELSGIMRELHYEQDSEKDASCKNLIKYLTLDNLLPHKGVLRALLIRETLAGSIPHVVKAAIPYLMGEDIWPADLIQQCTEIRNVVRNKSKTPDPLLRGRAELKSARLRASIEQFQRPYPLPATEPELDEQVG